MRNSLKLHRGNTFFINGFSTSNKKLSCKNKKEKENTTHLLSTGVEKYFSIVALSISAHLPKLTFF